MFTLDNILSMTIHPKKKPPAFVTRNYEPGALMSLKIFSFFFFFLNHFRLVLYSKIFVSKSCWSWFQIQKLRWFELVYSVLLFVWSNTFLLLFCLWKWERCSSWKCHLHVEKFVWLLRKIKKIISREIGSQRFGLVRS